MKQKIHLFFPLTILSIIATFSFTTDSAIAAESSIPKLINYQGYLTDQNGKALTGNYTITFRLYDELSGTHAWLWQETQDTVRVENGQFNVLLGSVSPLSADDFEGDRYLEIQLANELEMEPRLQLVSVAYSLRAEKAHSLVNHVAFSAYLASNELFNDYDPLPLKSTSNNIGNHFDTETSKFTAPVKGIYLFTIIGVSSSTTTGLNWLLMVNNQYANSTGKDIVETSETCRISWWAASNTSSRTIILKLNKDDKVHVKQAGTGRCDNFRSGMEGVLLYEIFE